MQPSTPSVPNSELVPNNGEGRPRVFIEPEPWPEPVDSAELSALAAAIRSHVIMEQAAADTVAP
jgi:hypothetical protein